MDYLYFRKDRNLYDNFWLTFSHFAANYLPRILYTFVETFIGFDEHIRVNFKIFPIVVNNNLGGTSLQNALHWR